MKKYIVLSVNENTDYTYFVPLCEWAWNRLGWETIVIHFNKEKSGEYRSDTMAQVSRLYAANFDFIMPDDLLMTGDIDMIPLSDYWKPDVNKITCYGHDLTGFGHYPICYIAMTAINWMKVMRLDKSQEFDKLIMRDLAGMPQAKNTDFYKYWFCDQDLITERLKPFAKDIVSIKRGQYSNGYAVGRIDRGNWSLEHSEYIDAHLHHQIHHRNNEWKLEQTLEMLMRCFPGEDFTWFINHHLDFQKQFAP